jgi:hypothetical protein
MLLTTSRTDYALRTARSLDEMLPSLTMEELIEMDEFERASKRRKSLLTRIEMRILRLRHNATLQNLKRFAPKPRR